MLWNGRNPNKLRGGLALLGDVIEFGILRKRFKEYSHPGLLDFKSVKLERLRNPANVTQRGSPQPFTSTSSKCYSQQAPESPLSIPFSSLYFLYSISTSLFLALKCDIKSLSLWLLLLSLHGILPFLPIKLANMFSFIGFQFKYHFPQKAFSDPIAYFNSSVIGSNGSFVFWTCNILVTNYSIAEFPWEKNLWEQGSISTLSIMMSSVTRKCLEWCLIFSGWI